MFGLLFDMVIVCMMMVFVILMICIEVIEGIVGVELMLCVFGSVIFWFFYVFLVVVVFFVFLILILWFYYGFVVW